MHIKNDHAGTATRNNTKMNSLSTVSILLLASLFSLTIETTNGLSLDPSSLWLLFTHAISSGNQYLFNWVRNILFGSSSGQNDTNVITSTEMSMETDDLVCEGLYTFMSFGNGDYRKPISGNITPRDIRFSIKSL
ncbi:hypothetical protein M0804_001294 [Polistes exclamans]|nr:hypothetical protein M0804_001294 [Polistes exclamans]